MEDLTAARCADLPRGTPGLGADEIAALMPRLHPDWRAQDGRLARRFAVTGYPPAVLLANAAAFLAEREGHHPDIGFGWGWVEVVFWTHTVGGLSRNDFICAAKLDAMVAGRG